MFSTISRAIFPRTARLVQARGMAHTTTEMPKTNGLVYMGAGLVGFIVTAALVQANGLVTWGTAPDRDSARSK